MEHEYIVTVYSKVLGIEGDCDNYLVFTDFNEALDAYNAFKGNAEFDGMTLGKEKKNDYGALPDASPDVFYNATYRACIGVFRRDVYLRTSTIE